MTTHEIEGVGVKHIMAMRFHVPIDRGQKFLQTLTVPLNEASVIQVDSGKPAHRLQVIGYDFYDHPVSSQVILMPDSEIPLELYATIPRMGS